MATATAMRCKDLDVESARALMVTCETCDPDNPLAVPRKSCPSCRGTGKTPVRLAGIVEEIRDSQKEKRRLLPVRGAEDSDLYLEY